MFAPRQADHYYGDNFQDQLIEQCLIRLKKSRGGLTQGRGITDSTLAKFTGTLPKCVPVCLALEAQAANTKTCALKV